MIKVVSDDDNISRICKISHDGDEKSMEVKNPMTSLAMEFIERSSPFISDQKNSYIRDSSSSRSEHNIQKTLMHILEDRISQSHLKMVVKEENIKTLKSELLLLVNRRPDLKLKKYNYKFIKIP